MTDTAGVRMARLWYEKARGPRLNGSPGAA
jgi:hypothetical protein